MTQILKVLYLFEFVSINSIEHPSLRLGSSLVVFPLSRLTWYADVLHDICIPFTNTISTRILNVIGDMIPS